MAGRPCGERRPQQEQARSFRPREGIGVYPEVWEATEKMKQIEPSGLIRESCQLYVEEWISGKHSWRRAELSRVWHERGRNSGQGRGWIQQPGWDSIWLQEQGGFRARAGGQVTARGTAFSGCTREACVCRGDSRGWMQKPGSQPEMGQQVQLWEKGDEQRAKVKRRDSV